MTLGSAVVYFNIMAQRVFWLNFLCFSEVFHNSGHFGPAMTRTWGWQRFLRTIIPKAFESWTSTFEIGLYGEETHTHTHTAEAHMLMCLHVRKSLYHVNGCHLWKCKCIYYASWLIGFIIYSFFLFFVKPNSCMALSFQRNTNTVHSVWLN